MFFDKPFFQLILKVEALINQSNSFLINSEAEAEILTNFANHFSHFIQKSGGWESNPRKFGVCLIQLYNYPKGWGPRGNLGFPSLQPNAVPLCHLRI